MPSRPRMLVVCGHPDDETIHMGGTLARYAAAGARVVCVTATRGELGDIVDPSLATAANFSRLGDIRMDEMARALALLGPIEARWLGYRDSGMPGDPRNGDPEAFCRADPEEVAGRIARLLREVQPQVVITLMTLGGSGHPDHLHAALATRLAFERAGDPRAWPEHLTASDALGPWAASKLYETRGRTRAELDRRARLRRAVRDRGPIMALPVIARAVPRLLPARQRVPASIVEGRRGPPVTCRRTDPVPVMSPGAARRRDPRRAGRLVAGRPGATSGPSRWCRPTPSRNPRRWARRSLWRAD